jgi:chromosomal replication initiator protein
LKFIQQNIDPNQFNLWFKPIKPVSLVESTLTVEVPSEFFREYVEGAYLELLRASLKKELGTAAKLVYVVTPVQRQQPLRYPASHGSEPVNRPVSIETFSRGGNPGPFVFPGIQRVQINPHLNPVYCFENLIVGECNKMVFTAGESISSAPGKTAFNPLFLFGGPGLGKTHLSTAVAKTVLDAGYDVLYTTAVTMVGDFEMVRFGNSGAAGDMGITADTSRYFDCDLLIIDDLGTEVMNQFTSSCLYNVINTRLSMRRPTVISTNLMQDELRRRYWDRITSRLFGEYKILLFLGTDVRAQKVKAGK